MFLGNVLSFICSSLFNNEEIKLIYLDADIVCVSNPSSEINSIIKEMDVRKVVAF